MRAKSLGYAGVLAFALAVPLAAPAGAAPAHCFDGFGAAIGPSFDTAFPNLHWIAWVQARGGTCRALQADEVAFFQSRVFDYPVEYTATLAPAAPPSLPPVLYSQPPTTATSVWLGNSARAAELVTIAYAQRGRPTSIVADTGRVIYRSDGVWRVYDVTWSDGYRRQVAVHMRPTREYYAIEADEGESWSTAVYLGR